jgi:cell division protein FtsW
MSSTTSGSIPTSNVANRSKHAPDYQLLACIGILVPFGLMMVYSASFVEGIVFREGDSVYYLNRQLVSAFVGTAGLLVAQRIDYRRLQTYALHMMLVSLLVLFAVVFIVPDDYTTTNGAQSWIKIGSLSVQPSEFAKLTLIIYMAAWLSQRGTRLRRLLTGMLPFAVSAGSIAALILIGGDLGSATVVVVVAALVYFIAGASLAHMALAVVIGLVSFLLAINVAAYRLDRINAWLDPETYSNSAWQPLHGLYALASGGLFGVGLGESRQKYLWLPQSFTDTILAIIGEEFGLIGTLFVVACFIFIAYRGFKIASAAPNGFAMLLATGITLWLVFQAIISFAVVTTLVPFTGITLPFLSYGGTSLMVSMVAVGILLNISKYTLVDAPHTNVRGLLHERYNRLVAVVSALWGRNRRSRLPVARRSGSAETDAS